MLGLQGNTPMLQPIQGAKPELPAPDFTAKAAKKMTIRRRASIDIGAGRPPRLGNPAFATVPEPKARPGSRLGSKPLVPNISQVRSNSTDLPMRRLRRSSLPLLNNAQWAGAVALGSTNASTNRLAKVLKVASSANQQWKEQPFRSAVNSWKENSKTAGETKKNPLPGATGGGPILRCASI